MSNGVGCDNSRSLRPGIDRAKPLACRRLESGAPKGMRPEDRKLLDATAFARAIGPQTTERLVRGAFVQALPRDTVLFLEGDMPEFVHLVLSGRVSLDASDARGRSTIVEIFRDGQIFILAAAVLQKPYLMNARTLAETRILLIPAGPFRRLLDDDPRLARALVDQLAAYWRLLVRQIKDLKLRSASERLAAYLLMHADTRRKSDAFRLSEELRVVAARLGITPESLSRAFVALRPFGVASRGRSVVVNDTAALRALCGFDEME